jgi:hypothetical protein
MRMVWSRRLVVPLVGLAFAVGGCGGATSNLGGAASEQASPAIAPGAPAADLSTGKSSGGAGGQASLMVDALNAPVTQPGSFISTATMTVAVADVGAVKPRVAAIAQEVGGSLFGEETTFGGRARSTITIKVPPAQFNQALDRLAGLGDVASQQVRTDDVTQQVIDLDARIAAASASLDRVRGLLGDARNINDVIFLESEVTRRQADLESLRGQQKTLQGRIALTTITVTLDGGPVARAGDGDLPGFLDGLEGGWEAARQVAILTSAAIGALLPFLPLIIVVVLVLRWLSRRARRRAEEARSRRSGWPGPPPPPLAGGAPPAPAPAPAPAPDDQPAPVG